MGKLIALFLAVATGFMSLLIFYHGPSHVSSPSVATPVPTMTIGQHVQHVCAQASDQQFGSAFEQRDLSIQYCVNALTESYAVLGHWPGPEMNGNNSEAFFAANKAALLWGAMLDVPYGYFASDGRDVIMGFMKQERESYGL